MGGLCAKWVASVLSEWSLCVWSQLGRVGGLSCVGGLCQVCCTASCSRPRHVITTLEAIVNEARHIPAYLPNVTALEEAMHRAHEWTCKVDGVQVGPELVYH